jgi:hypothetical protein
MAVIVRVRDEIPGGARSPAVEVCLEPPPRTVRELIRQCVEREVARRSTTPPVSPPLRVELAEKERLLNGERSLHQPPLDVEEQFRRACQAFQAQRVILLIGERQALELEEPVEVTSGCEITFLGLVPLIGG